MHILNLLDEGPLDYMKVDAIQRDVHDRVAKLEAPDTFIVWEARDTYTAGRRTKDEDIPDKSIPVIPMDRGGSVTYHGPGQVVIYPVIKVKPPKDVVAFVRNIERAVITALDEVWGIESSQVEGRSGIWIQCPGQIDRKICAIGVKFADDATMHGLAFNVSTDLTKFGRIVPCGISDASVASLELLDIHTTVSDAADALIPYLDAQLRQFQRPERIEE
ncbi:lipoyl(octanoyl) transferase LipB [Arcanobacterium haemolyticum]|nr:lipoyl(octanoyl) transferase LipB [Arcanobacterium haemolyticum]